MLGGTDDAYVREVSFIDPSTRQMKMYSVNLSLSRESASIAPPFPPLCSLRTACKLNSLLSLALPFVPPFVPYPHPPTQPAEYLTVLESISYTPHHSSPNSQTLFSQSAEISARGFTWKSFADKLEQFSLDQFISNAANGKIGFENVLKGLFGDDNDGPVKARIGMGIEWPKGATAVVGGDSSRS
jgi:hypothetical protein